MKTNIKKELEKFKAQMVKAGKIALHSDKDSNVEMNRLGAAELFFIVASICHTALEYKDAAEFEARVAVKLALNPTRNSPPCPYGNSRTCTCECDSKHRSCIDNRLKWARLAVEQEMEEI